MITIIGKRIVLAIQDLVPTIIIITYPKLICQISLLHIFFPNTFFICYPIVSHCPNIEHLILPLFISDFSFLLTAAYLDL